MLDTDVGALIFACAACARIRKMQKKSKRIQLYAVSASSDLSRKNKVTNNLVKVELDMDQVSMKAFTQFHDKRF